MTSDANPPLDLVEADGPAILAGANPAGGGEARNASGRKPKVVVQNLTKRFGDLLVLDNISFSVGQGEFLCIVGPTGCGKTTFLNCLSKLLPTTEGTIFIDGACDNER